MRCKTCDYRLWNLTARRCPECGTPFRPSEFEFIPNSVQFCCPHCNQSYYGTGEKGHLVPAAFDCVSCGKHIHMDEMVLLPTEGVKEEQTKVFRVPWLERKKRGRIKAWFSTIDMAMHSPIRLMRGLPPESSVAQAWWFAMLVTIPAAAMSGIAFAVFPVLMLSGFGGGRGGFPFAIGLGIILVLGILGIVIALAIWGLVAHGILCLTGRRASGIGRTFQAICYSSGANAPTAVPCVGIYVGPIWWTISAILMLKEAQRVHGGRATLAVLTFPTLALVALIGFQVWFTYSMMSRARAMASMTAPASTSVTAETRVVLDALLGYVKENSGKAPGHAIQLVIENHLSAADLLSSSAATIEQNVPVAGTTLAQLRLLPQGQQHNAVQTAINALPKSTVAHRLGDFVFTYHGIDLAKPDPRLWLVILSADPDANPSPLPGAGTLTVGRADGTVFQIGPAFTGKLAAQNAIRAQHNLPPLPVPSTVTHAKPALANR